MKEIFKDIFSLTHLSARVFYYLVCLIKGMEKANQPKSQTNQKCLFFALILIGTSAILNSVIPENITSIEKSLILVSVAEGFPTMNRECVIFTTTKKTVSCFTNVTGKSSASA